jgi:phage internal scaffolding protein
MTIKNLGIRTDDYLQRKWLGQADAKTRGDIDFSGDPGKTDPSHAKDADINNIIATYVRTGVLPGNEGPQIFADVSDVPSYQDALQTVINAENAFMTLDAKTRKKFDNDPEEMLRFLSNPANREEATTLGMISKSAPTPSPASPKAPVGRAGPSNPSPDTKSDEK